MKYIAGFLFIVVGVLLVVFALIMRAQFGAVVAQASPDSVEYPLPMKLLIPDPSTSDGGGASAPDKAAETVTFRIYGLGVVGLVNIVGGALILILGVKKRNSEQQPEGPPS